MTELGKTVYMKIDARASVQRSAILVWTENKA